MKTTNSGIFEKVRDQIVAGSGRMAFVICAALTGCVGYVDEPRGGAYAETPSAYGASGAVRDDYLYYPGYQVYYSSNRRQYIYQDGRSWVWRPAPPHVSVDVLAASPSVRLDFHDSPAIHHATVVQKYPKHWTPPEQSHDHNQGHGEHN
jgi:hypothetical protein